MLSFAKTARDTIGSNGEAAAMVPEESSGRSMRRSANKAFQQNQS
jgi:hypothetical protein